MWTAKNWRATLYGALKQVRRLAPPTVTAVTPLNIATGVGLNTVITATFDEAMDPANDDWLNIYADRTWRNLP